MFQSQSRAEGDRDQEGFTLVEALIAIALMSLLSLLVLGALRFGIIAWQRGHEVSNRVDEFAHAEAFLRRVIGNASPQFLQGDGAKGYVEFDGRSASLRLIADPPQSLDRAGRIVITLSAEEKAGRNNLVISMQPELTPDQAILPEGRRILLADVGKVEFSYFGAKGSRGQPAWHSEWTRESALPELVRIALSSSKEDPSSAIIVRPKIDVDVSCIYDTLTRRCRGR